MANCNWETGVFFHRIYLDKHPARIIITAIKGDVVLIARGDGVSSFFYFYYVCQVAETARSLAPFDFAHSRQGGQPTDVTFSRF